MVTAISRSAYPRRLRGAGILDPVPRFLDADDIGGPAVGDQQVRAVLGAEEVLQGADPVDQQHQIVLPAEVETSLDHVVADALVAEGDFQAFGEEGQKVLSRRIRRQVVGDIKHILQNMLDITDNLSANPTTENLLSFFAERLKVALRDQGIRHDVIQACFDLGGQDDLVLLVNRVRTLQDFLGTEDGAHLLVAYRRAANIVGIEESRDGVEYSGTPEPARVSRSGNSRDQ